MKDQLQALEARIQALETKIEALETKLANVKVRDRGPTSTREMSREDARRVIFGDLASNSHKECAEILGLSYAQIYSARGEYTFKDIHREKEELRKQALQTQNQ